MPKFEVGDKVRRINEPFAEISVGDIGTVAYCDNVTLKLKEFPLRGVPGQLHGFMPRNFELVSKGRNRADINLKGEILKRSNGTATLKLDSGETVIVPESLVPVDPKILKYREILADFSFVAEDSEWERRIMNGDADQEITQLIAKHNL